MMKFGRLCAAVLLTAVVLAGCGKDYEKMLEEHKAVSMQEDGIWEARYEQCKINDATDVTTVIISVNVMKNMTENDMLEVLDYMELQYNARFDDEGVYQGKKEDAEYICYAVFYRKDTDEEIKRIKYVKGESVEIRGEDEVHFAGPELRDMDDESE